MTQVLLTVFAIVALFGAVHSQVENDEWDPTTRDRTQQCDEFKEWTKVEYFCKAFNNCCEKAFDPLNGDKCQTKTQVCEKTGDDSFHTVCQYQNCTEMITTTTTTTTPLPREEYANSGINVFTATSIVVSFLYQIIVV
ncbi:unnamed protein product [Caenorhabditis angaria]|uniref:Uncharacterized protein n=1 Tax=Caenorhabditis angaria TaxID=860376 RepID=A0A9P1N8K7_9PELO|nr:unnamed protein product [Caenorhabditis angaria]